jgi:thiol-disulfide isomerase/thioredoxin
LAPELEGGQWIQHGPVSLKAQRDKAVVLIDFWDYTCVNCIRTLPYVAEWHRRYADSGLVVVGVHAPEFSFAREGSHVAEAAKRFGLEYPIVLDNEYAIWRAYSNRFWPAKYLVDSKGRIRYYHFGEGSYQESEVAIQGAIRELNPTASLPPPIEPIRDMDRPGTVCYRVTPELYLGHARGQFGNPEGVTRDHGHDYRDVNLVMAPPADATVRVEIKLEGSQKPGDDVKFEGDRGFVTVDQPRMYSLVANESVVSGSLVLRAEQAGLSAYAFTFISCAVS